MVNGTVPADHVVSADLCLLNGKGLERLRTAVLSSMVDDDKVGFAQIEVDGSHPIGVSRYGIRSDWQRGFADDARIISGLLLIHFIGLSIGIDGTAGSKDYV